MGNLEIIVFGLVIGILALIPAYKGLILRKITLYGYYWFRHPERTYTGIVAIAYGIVFLILSIVGFLPTILFLINFIQGNIK